MIVRVIFISSFLLYCLLLKHIFQTHPNMITNCLKLILSVTTYNYIAPASLFDFWTGYKSSTVFSPGSGTPAITKEAWNRGCGTEGPTRDGGARRTPPTNSAGQQTAAGKYTISKRRRERVQSRIWKSNCRLTFLFLLPSFKLVSLSLSRISFYI